MKKPAKAKRHYGTNRISKVDEFLDEVGAKLCNCAECNTILLSVQSKIELACNTKARSLMKELPDAVAGKVNQRPYCRNCLLLWR